VSESGDESIFARGGYASTHDRSIIDVNCRSPAALPTLTAMRGLPGSKY